MTLKGSALLADALLAHPAAASNQLSSPGTVHSVHAHHKTTGLINVIAAPQNFADVLLSAEMDNYLLMQVKFRFPNHARASGQGITIDPANQQMTQTQLDEPGILVRLLRAPVGSTSAIIKTARCTF